MAPAGNGLVSPGLEEIRIKTGIERKSAMQIASRSHASP
jgi:hypothetical protein